MLKWEYGMAVARTDLVLLTMFYEGDEVAGDVYNETKLSVFLEGSTMLNRGSTGSLGLLLG